MIDFKNSAKSFSLAALLLLTSLSSRADTLSSPFNIALSAPSTLALLGGVSQVQIPAGTYRGDLPNQTITTPFAVSITGIHLALNYAFNTPTAGSNLNEWNIQSSSIGAEIVVDSINASQTIVQGEGGSQITIRLDAVCSDVHLALTPGATQINATIGVSLEGNRAVYRLNRFSANWTPDAWQITSLNCTGPQGFGDIVRQNVAAQLRSINPFLPAIQSQIESQLAAASGQPISWTVRAPDASGVSLTLQPGSLQVQPDGSVIVGGQALVTFSKLNGTACNRTITEPAAAPAGADTLVLPVAAVQGLIQCAYLNGSLSAHFTSQQIPAFQSLLGNPLLKLIIWPHLLRYNRNSVFGFDLSLSEAPVFGPVTSGTTGGFQFDLTTTWTLAVFAPKPEGLVHYVDFFAAVDGPANLSLTSGVLKFTQTPSTLTLTRTYDPDYLARYRPNRRIWMSVVARSLRSFLANTGVSYTLPVFQAPTFTLAVDSATLSGTSANLQLVIRPITPPAKRMF